jgi:hypothetical protein
MPVPVNATSHYTFASLSETEPNQRERPKGKKPLFARKKQSKSSRRGRNLDANAERFKLREP